MYCWQAKNVFRKMDSWCIRLLYKFSKFLTHKKDHTKIWSLIRNDILEFLQSDSGLCAQLHLHESDSSSTDCETWLSSGVIFIITFCCNLQGNHSIANFVPTIIMEIYYQI